MNVRGSKRYDAMGVWGGVHNSGTDNSRPPLSSLLSLCGTPPPLYPEGASEVSHLCEKPLLHTACSAGFSYLSYGNLATPPPPPEICTLALSSLPRKRLMLVC